ncbi:tetratricopeptide repeat protein [Rhodoligotrophos defluvii]|uniref:tetratricopeptide repeat protein n=1 Tax=Rhodoligotrophos defluvii TaxID=2561934 RepID=UPI00196102E1|nr:tetratricopeptide repeat protein [Rhodoligotrophos defluvii]
MRAGRLSLCAAVLLGWGAAAAPALSQSPLQEQGGPPADSNAAGPTTPLPPMPASPAEAARQRADLLDSLFARLHNAQNETSAAVLQEAVAELWSRSGSPTVDVLVKQADQASRKRQFQTALTILDTVVEIAPEFPEAWNKRATVLFLQGDRERALADLERVLELEPRHFGALTALGVVLRAQGDKKEALEAFKRALEINPHLDEAKKAVEQLEREAGQPI